jgi:hypothetical protein
MKPTFSLVIRGWLISATIALILNLAWFFALTARTGNPYAEIIGPLPILVATVLPTFFAAVIYWLLTRRLRRADLVFILGAVVLTFLSILGQPQLHDGSIVPSHFRLIDIPMHFITGFSAAFLLPAIVRGKTFNRKKETILK